MAPASRVREAIERELVRARIPGCSVAVVNDAGAVFSDAFGWADVRARRRATPDTVYHLFSGTKVFTAAAVLRLVEGGRLSLEDPVAKYFPELPLAPELRVVDLLSHRSGLKDSLKAFLAIRLPSEAIPTSAEALALYPIAADGPPARTVAYRNVNYALLGDMITRLAGIEYREYVVREILRPLEMEAAFAISDVKGATAATGYIDRWDPMRAVLWFLLPEMRGRLYGERVSGETASGLVELRDFNLVPSAIGGLVGTVLDFGRFVSAQLRGASPVLTADSTRRMQTMVAEGAAGIESRYGMGLGWKLGRAGERLFLNHEGGGAGFTTELRIYPEARLGVALAMNHMRMPGTMKLAHRVCEMLVSG
jgi:CubicO group peptidase (beta-lactamase class C family)